jgi:hypothetical protein
MASFNQAKHGVQCYGYRPESGYNKDIGSWTPLTGRCGGKLGYWYVSAEFYNKDGAQTLAAREIVFKFKGSKAALLSPKDHGRKVFVVDATETWMQTVTAMLNNWCEIEKWPSHDLVPEHVSFSIALNEQLQGRPIESLWTKYNLW